MKILIGGAWPYANGSLHIGHLAALLPADVIARYYRAKGDDVYYVSGSDCHGTPVAIRALQEVKSPEEVSDYYHNEFSECFNKLGFSYDYYGKTSQSEHKDFIREFHRTMYNGEYIYEAAAPAAFCEQCKTALADRFVVGKCPDCAEKARGDQCDACGTVLDPENLLEPTCARCGSAVSFRDSKQLFIKITALSKELSAFIDAHPYWRKNAIAFSRRYINEGLRDRAVTRDLNWGIDVPMEGYEDKKIYIWAENVLGYLSMSKIAAELRGEDYNSLWGENARHYYIHGKDNIPFHTIILPSLLMANGRGWHLPDDIISSEYLTLEGCKISTSGNWAIWVRDIIERYHPDSIRYFMMANGPEKRDTDFTWREFVNSHNSELLGAYGNFINRTLAFIYKYLDKTVPNGEINCEIDTKINAIYPVVGTLIEDGKFKEAIETVFNLVRYGNKYFDTEKPWETRNSDIGACNTTIYNCVQILANLSILLEPFLPFSSAKVKDWFKLDGSWTVKKIPAGYIIPEPEILFERLDKKVIDEELDRLSRNLLI